MEKDWRVSLSLMKDIVLKEVAGQSTEKGSAERLGFHRSASSKKSSEVVVSRIEPPAPMFGVKRNQFVLWALDSSVVCHLDELLNHGDRCFHNLVFVLDVWHFPLSSGQLGLGLAISIQISKFFHVVHLVHVQGLVVLLKSVVWRVNVLISHCAVLVPRTQREEGRRSGGPWRFGGLNGWKRKTSSGRTKRSKPAFRKPSQSRPRSLKPLVNKWFIDKGFGFGKNSSEVVFIHASAVQGAEVLIFGIEAWV